MWTPLQQVAAYWVGRFGSLRLDVEDVVQSTFERLFAHDLRRLRSYDPTKGLTVEGWVRRIGRQTALSMIRKAMRERSRQEHLEEDPESWWPSAEIPLEVQADARRILAWIRAKLQGEALLLFELYLEEVSMAEIADALEITEGAAGSRVARLRQWLQQIPARRNGKPWAAE